MNKTQRLLQQMSQIEQQAVQQMADDYPLGTKVKWKHRERRRHGEVTGHHAARLRLEVATSRCARVWVDIADLED